ncbi:hypothetical protein AB0I22_36530 [Streptomyces sp. NPDC050610]|uniref:hypothetical protein n=1 Tax=Streptomyces sp. NPDC050610 TaxID=3157097 RepID=UPI003429C5F8
MSDERQAPDAGPQPTEIRFYGTTWLNHDGGYALRRAATAIGALVAAAAGCLVLRFAFQGVADAKAGSLVNVLLVVAFAICSALAFRHTWSGFVRRPDAPADAAAEKSMRSIRVIGFVGILLAYFCRTFVEAPGEKLRRAEYEEERRRYERRRTARTGNPAGKAKKRKNR